MNNRMSSKYQQWTIGPIGREVVPVQAETKKKINM
jgi:hypothetical protein